jgi:hypothetical protein
MSNGVYKSSIGPEIVVSMNAKRLLYALRVATHECHTRGPNDLKSTTKLAQARLDIVRYIAKLERNQLPAPSLNMSSFYHDLAAFGTAAIKVPSYREIDKRLVHDKVDRPFAPLTRRQWDTVGTAFQEWVGVLTRLPEKKVEPLRVNPYAAEGIA